MTDARPTTFRWPTAAELRWAAGFALGIMAITCLPYLYGLFIRPEGAYYSGLLANPDEHNVYLAYMKEAQEGAVFLVDPFTSEPQYGRVINLFFLLLGRVARITGLALPVVYHIARVICGWLLLMAIYCLGAQAIKSVWARRLALCLAALASGFGWLYHASPGQPNPIDFGPGLVMPEAITFLTLLLSPLFCFSVFLMIAGIGLGAHALASRSTRSAVLAGLAMLVLGNIHSYDVIPVAVVLSAYLVVLAAGKRVTARGIALAGLMALIAAPSLLYQFWLLRSGEFTLTAKTTECPAYSPDAIFLALGLGLPLLLALGGIWGAARPGGSDGARLLALWLVLGFALAYAPVPFQRKLAQGVQIPAVLLMVVALEPAVPRLGRLKGLVGLLAVVVCLPSNALFLVRAKADLETNNHAYVVNLMPPLYLREDQHAALTWLDEHASFRDRVLCNSFLGSYAPSLAGVRVYVGHWCETSHFRQKLGDLAAFLRAGAPDADREAFVERHRIGYFLRDRSVYDQVFLLAPDGSELPAFDGDRAAWLEKTSERDAVSLYRVR